MHEFIFLTFICMYKVIFICFYSNRFKLKTNPNDNKSSLDCKDFKIKNLILTSDARALVIWN